MKSMTLKSFFILTLFFGLSSAFGALPAHDPRPMQKEPTQAEVESRKETSRVAVPRESSSFFSIAGFRDDAAETLAAAGGANSAAARHALLAAHVMPSQSDHHLAHAPSMHGSMASMSSMSAVP